MDPKPDNDGFKIAWSEVEIQGTVLTQKIVALSFPTLVFLVQLSLKGNYLSRATIFIQVRIIKSKPNSYLPIVKISKKI